MNSKKGFGIIEGLIAALAILFVISLFSSFRGWGYPGYGGYYHPSFLYWGSPQTYSGPSVRENSSGGSGFSGGGLHGGK